MVADTRGYDWEDDAHPRTPFNRTIIYEMHVGGFTKSPTSGIETGRRGTYAGLIEKIPYLVNLGITMHNLLSACEHFPAYYDTLSHNIPESNNELPDLLDEAKWNLDWMLWWFPFFSSGTCLIYHCNV